MTVMIQRLTYKALSLFGMLCVMTSCQQDALSYMSDNRNDRLTARKCAVVTRSVPPNSHFDQNTAYRLWAYRPDNNEYMFAETSNGILAKESSGRYIEMSQDNAKLLREAFNIYGFTDESKLTDDTDEKVLAADASSNHDNPTYTISYNEKLETGYPDYYRAYLEYDSEDENKTSPIMEFKHILSRVRVQVIQQDNGQASGGSDKEGLYQSLLLHAVELQGVYDTETYDVRQGTFSSPVNQANRILREVAEGEDIIPAEASTAPFSESYVFPTLEQDKEEALILRLTIGGDDAKVFSNKEAGDGKYYVDMTLYDRYKTDKQGNYTIPLVFEANHSYMLRIIFAKDGIVTFVPEVYPWFDGETENEENGEGYEEQTLGNIHLFDNLIWFDRNLGAEDYYPDDSESFKKCTGFFYQFGRNIPYFPMKNENDVLTDWLVDGTEVYPVVSDPIGRWHAPHQRPVTDANENAPANIPFVTEVEKINSADLAAGLQSLSYNCWPNGFDSNLWSDVLTQPTPPGWRLPTQEEFFGILPSTPYAGNISFMRNVKWYGPGEEAGGAGSAVFQDKRNVIYVHIPTSEDYPDWPSSKVLDITDPASYMYNAPGYGDNYMPSGDPYEGYSSEYIISKEYPDEKSEPIQQIGTTAKPVWGVIYGIKKVGTTEAYRMRWRIMNTDPSGNFYALVIERFMATATDRLSYDENAPNYYRKYDWERPSAVLYLPISGMIGEAQWQEGSGKLGNFGVETIFATSEPGESYVHQGKRYQTYKTYRIKLYGTDRLNQFLYPAADRRGSGAQIRLVRESTYQPDRK